MTEQRFPDLHPSAVVPNMSRIPAALAAMLALVALVIGGSGHAVAATNFPSAFVVAGVPVDATAQNAVAAREAARLQGQRAAFRRLLERLTPKSAWPRLPMPGDETVVNLVQDFEVANERSSGVRYLANYTFRFNPTGIRKLLHAAGLPITELASKPVVIVPVLKSGTSTRVWDAPNPWRDGWTAAPGNSGLVPWTVPIGYLADVGTMDAAAASDPKPDQLQALAQRYGNGDVVVATAMPSVSGDEAALEITVSRYGPDGTPESASTRVTGPKPDAALYQAGVQAAVRELEEQWKKLTFSANGDQENQLEVSILVASAHDWAVVRDRLTKVPMVRATELELMTHSEVRLRLKIKGDTNLLKVALAQQDLVLTMTNPYATVQLRNRTAADESAKPVE
jgi:hypothetical protein